MKIEGSRILVTGGSSGIGKETARMLVDKGAKVLITGRDETKTREVAKEIGAMALAADISTEEGVDQTFDAVEKQLGGLDVLINNAGIGRFGELTEITLKDFEDVFSTNVYGAALAAQKAARIFKEQKRGNIINIASSAGVKGFSHGTVYAASKFALRGMTECWRAELRPYNVRVILVNPSEVTTAFNQPGRKEREEVPNKLRPTEIAHSIVSALEMDDRGFITELSVWATNPF
ncbi:MAG: SDR family oxidoreductase [Bacteroidota bacterium]|nr:SDR family oxidoreductase [Bacteroidota bacterium]